MNAEYYFNNTLQHLKPPFMVFTERIVGGIPHFITGTRGREGGREKEGRGKNGREGGSLVLWIHGNSSFPLLPSFNIKLGAGGFLQNIVFGYTGLQIEDTNITVYPSFLPPGTTTKITLRKVSSSSPSTSLPQPIPSSSPPRPLLKTLLLFLSFLLLF